MRTSWKWAQCCGRLFSEWKLCVGWWSSVAYVGCIQGCEKRSPDYGNGQQLVLHAHLYETIIIYVSWKKTSFTLMWKWWKRGFSRDILLSEEVFFIFFSASCINKIGKLLRLIKETRDTFQGSYVSVIYLVHFTVHAYFEIWSICSCIHVFWKQWSWYLWCSGLKFISISLTSSLTDWP